MKYYHRNRNFWESTYLPGIDEIISEYDWADLNKNIGPVKQKCDISKINNSSYSVVKFTDKIFDTCDFFGEEKSTIFSGCEFKNCYFGRSLWNFTKFQKCKFSGCSFSFTKFSECQFIDCRFERISLSGNETKFVKCIIDPERLINAAYTNLDREVLKQYGHTVAYQRYRLEKTKSEIAKALSLSNNSASEFYYSSIKVATIQEIVAQIEYSRYQISILPIFGKSCFFLKLLAFYLEKFVLDTMGWMNGWGGNLARVISLGILIVFCFSIIYILEAIFKSNSNIYYPTLRACTCSLVKSCDITFVAGYTKYTEQNCLTFVNMLIGLFWYSVAIPTIINKLTKSRF